jgi:hypothetical protein
MNTGDDASREPPLLPSEPLETSRHLPLKGLGVDVLGQIFEELVLMMHVDVGDLESLLLVSREWRLAALLTTKLWSTISITWPSGPLSTFERWKARTARHLVRSGGACLKISMEFKELPTAHRRDPTCRCGEIGYSRRSYWNDYFYDCSNTSIYMERIQTAVGLVVGEDGAHMQRWGDLEIHWGDLISFKRFHPRLRPDSFLECMRYPTPHLKRLVLDCLKTSVDILPSMPALQSLVLSSCQIIPLKGLHHDLKYLHLAAIHTPPYFPHHTTLRSLTHLTLSICTSRILQPDSSEWYDCTLPSLHTLEIYQLHTNIIGGIKAPHLKTLILQVPGCFCSNYKEIGPESRMKPSELQSHLSCIETLSVFWHRGFNLNAREFLGHYVLDVLRLAQTVSNIQIDEELYSKGRDILHQAFELLPNLLSITLCHGRTAVEVHSPTSLQSWKGSKSADKISLVLQQARVLGSNFGVVCIVPVTGLK